MLKIPMEYEYAWYILRYHKDFYGRLSDNDCIRRIADETGGVNLVEYSLRKKELTKLSAEEIDILKRILEKYDLYVDL